jgi:aldose 1-epimerase
LKLWTLIRFETQNESVVLSLQYISPDGEENFPGNTHGTNISSNNFFQGTLTTTVEYTISSKEVSWKISAVTDKTTIANLTNHAYWNLENLDSSILDQEIQLKSSKYMPVDSDCLVTGEVASVSDSKLGDLQSGKKFKTILETFGDVDNNFFVDGYYEKKSELDVALATVIYSPVSGRQMSVLTSDPCIQVYTGNVTLKFLF